MAEENTKNFEIEIITPDRVFYKGEADFIEFNTVDGELGIYKKHVPLTSVLQPGVVTIHKDGEVSTAAVHAGFVEVLPDKVTFLAEIAEWPDEIDLNRAEQAKKRAEERLAAKAANLDFARAEYALKKALVRLDTRK